MNWYDKIINKIQKQRVISIRQREKLTEGFVTAE